MSATRKRFSARASTKQIPQSGLDFSDFNEESKVEKASVFSSLKSSVVTTKKNLGEKWDRIQEDRKREQVAQSTTLQKKIRRVHRLRLVSSSPFYKVFKGLFVTFMLFGHILSDLYASQKQQVAFDVVGFFAILFLLGDVAMNCYTEPNYFVWQCCGTGVFKVGSFLFWADLISAVTLIADISWFAPRQFAVREMKIVLNAWRIPVEGVEHLQPDLVATPFDIFISLLLRTTRVARLVRHSGCLYHHTNRYYLSTHRNPFSPKIRRRARRRIRNTFLSKEQRRLQAAITIQRWWRRIRRTPRLPTQYHALHGSDRSHAKKQPNPESQVGTAMRELTGQRVAVGIFLSLLVTFLFTYMESSTIQPKSMVVLHSQTQIKGFALTALEQARAYAIPDLFHYTLVNGVVVEFPLRDIGPSELRDRDQLQITITDNTNNSTVGIFNNHSDVVNRALTDFALTVFIIFIYILGFASFTGPVMTLVVLPIERMIKLLNMLMTDPLGYQDSFAFKTFVQEEKELPQMTGWNEEELHSMETSFLMSNILRIGSLMKVGFGSAGVEIIRNSLATTGSLFLSNSRGSTVSCIFMFCDVRQFTDATESLQEEVFVFTNKIASVVHSFISAYGGSANKNVGDAFLLSWLLQDDGNGGAIEGTSVLNALNPEIAARDQADKALLAVIKISICLYHDQYFLEEMSENAKNRLLDKLKNRPGPVVQIGCGLHAGQAVQGAIGSPRKIDPSYVSEAVDLSEFLESSTKRYGVKLLMSGAFHSLLHPTNQRRCRKLDSVLIAEVDEDEVDVGEVFVDEDSIMDLYTYDIYVDALWSTTPPTPSADSERTDSSTQKRKPSMGHRKRSSLLVANAMRRRSSKDEDLEKAKQTTSSSSIIMPEIKLPTSQVIFHMSDYTTEEMKKIRYRYSDGLFFQTFSSGLQSFYARDWDRAKQCFEKILDRFEDGPSLYFLNKMKANNYVPPFHFKPYNTD